MAEFSQAQHAAALALASLSPIEKSLLDRSVAARIPPLIAEAHHRNPVWRDGLFAMLDVLDKTVLPEPARAVIAGLRTRPAREIEDLADKFFHDALRADNVGEAFYIAAALQVYFTRLAGDLDASTLQLLPQRGLCPCCGSTPVSGLITASGQVPGTRYLYCSLCSTAWNHARAVCITCECSGTLSLKSIEGDDGAVKAETCDDCHTYAKMLYQANDTQVDPYADDLATLGLDVMVAEAGWARHAPNPLLLIEQADA
jgi:FdhE protein